MYFANRNIQLIFICMETVATVIPMSDMQVAKYILTACREVNMHNHILYVL